MKTRLIFLPCLWLLLTCFPLSAHAGMFSYKCLYVQAEAYPTGSGTVYLEQGQENEELLKDKSDDFGSEAILKAVIPINEGWDVMTDCVNIGGDTDGLFARISIQPAEGYELVCLANNVYDDGVYGYSDCYAVCSESMYPKVMSWDYTGDRDIINVNNPLHPIDADDFGESLPLPGLCLHPDLEFLWSEEPDTRVYAIFRKVGDEFPKFDPDYPGHSGPEAIDLPSAGTRHHHAVYNLKGQAVGNDYKGIVIVDGKKVVRR